MKDKIFAERFKECRLEMGLTQKQVATLFHTTQSTIAKWENADQFPSVPTLKTICFEFKISADYLLGIE